MKFGIYVHIPFCKKKCDYCDFLSAPATKEQYLQYYRALLLEIESYRGQIIDRQADSIFFGGGTPSILEAEWIEEILEKLKEIFLITPDAEVTLECNPGTLNLEKLIRYKKAGINRLSIGLQSAKEKELKLLGRIHTWNEFLDNYLLAREQGFSNINVDLMSGIPAQTRKSFEQTLQKIVKLQPEHLSVYSLILEKGTPFYKRYAMKEEIMSEEEDRNLYADTERILKEYGYDRYEISNYAKRGYECRHNTKYWIRTDYLGLGLGAASLWKSIRFHNEKNLEQYIKLSYDFKKLRRNIEKLTKEDAMSETMFLGLRRMEGVSKQKFYECFHIKLEDIYKKTLQKMKECGCLEENEDYVWLTRRGIDVSNLVMCEFIL